MDVRVHGLALDRPRPDERDLDGQVVEVLGLRPQEALHLRPALDLEVADGVGSLNLGVDVRVVERDPREVDRLAVGLGDLVDAVLDRREHPEPEQVDLEEAGVGARVLVPLAELAPRHRRGLHRHELDERPGRDHHPARMLRDVAREAADLAGQLRESAPARREQLALVLGEQRELLGDPLRAPPVRDPRQPLELGERKPERLADVADRPARAVGGEARDERGVAAAVPLGHGDDQLLADVAREVEVDVGHRRELPVQEAAEREVRRDRIDVREPGQVADDRADRAAAPTPRRQRAPRRVASPHLVRALARELEHLPVEQEEAGEPELVDQRELLVAAAPEPRRATVCYLAGSGRRTRPRRPARAAGSRALRRRRSRDSGSRAPRSGRTRAARRAPRFGERRRDRPGRAPRARRARAGCSRGCRAARAHSRRARCAAGSRRARPGARSAGANARARSR